LIFAVTVSFGRTTITSVTAAIVFGLAFVMAYVVKWHPIVGLGSRRSSGLYFMLLSRRCDLVAKATAGLGVRT
jgi:hypothetical protein